MSIFAIVLITFIFSLRDDGGTANGGVDTSAPFTITIRVTVPGGPKSVMLTWDNPTTRVKEEIPLEEGELDAVDIRYTLEGSDPVVDHLNFITDVWTSPELDEGTYTFEVRVRDWAGWWSDYCEPVEVAL